MKALILIVILLSSAAAQVRPLPAAEATGTNLPIQRIGANDLVAISVYDAPELTRTVRVDAEGFVRLPMLKHRLQAVGLMPAELDRQGPAVRRAHCRSLRDSHGGRVQQPSGQRDGRRAPAADVPGGWSGDA